MDRIGCQNPSTIVKAETFQSQFSLVGDRFIHLRQERSVAKKQVINEAWGNIWSFAIADIPEGMVAMRRDKEAVPVNGKVGIFLPPFSTVEWILSAGSISYDVVLSTRMWPDSFRMWDLAVFFPYISQSIPGSPEEALKIISEATEHQIIERGTSPHPVAKKLKHLIAGTFEQEHSLGVLAEKLGTSPAFLARKFKESYGMQPVAYRSQLRVHESMRILLSEPSSITQAGYKGGFQDLSRFNKQFRKHLGATPTDYKIEFAPGKN